MATRAQSGRERPQPASVPGGAEHGLLPARRGRARAASHSLKHKSSRTRAALPADSALTPHGKIPQTQPGRRRGSARARVRRAHGQNNSTNAKTNNIHADGREQRDIRALHRPRMQITTVTTPGATTRRRKAGGTHRRGESANEHDAAARAYTRRPRAKTRARARRAARTSRTSHPSCSSLTHGRALHLLAPLTLCFTYTNEEHRRMPTNSIRHPAARQAHRSRPPIQTAHTTTPPSPGGAHAARRRLGFHVVDPTRPSDKAPRAHHRRTSSRIRSHTQPMRGGGGRER